MLLGSSVIPFLSMAAVFIRLKDDVISVACGFLKGCDYEMLVFFAVVQVTVVMVVLFGHR
jgi:hypothetical protein